jgi:ERCC4-type nuclease
MIILDSRESFLKMEITDNTLFECKQLHVGDVIINNIIFERKTWDDLYSSIISKRFAEQRERLKETRVQSENCIVIYIIEGKKKASYKKIVDGALENLILFHNIPVMYTGTPKETMELLLKIHDKVLKKECESDKGGGGGLIQVVRKSKISENIFLHQLALIPGVSVNIAKKITDVYPKITNLVAAFSEFGNEVLQDIQVNKRKLGKILSKRIHDIYT